MKKLICLLLACALFASGAMAAEWGEGLSAAKPYKGVNEVDLTTTMGYILLYPRTNVMPASHFCDTLTIYLPREDVKLNTGKLSLYKGTALYANYEFSDTDHVHLRKLGESELAALSWGSGVAIDVWLNESLTIGESYYVLMDEGCFVNTDETLKSIAISNPEAWRPAVTGEYGVNGLRYYEGEDAASPAKINPQVGDSITFDLVLGGDAKSAVVYSNNDSVQFETKEYSESATITGEVTGENLTWGIVFINEQGDVLDVVRLGN